MVDPVMHIWDAAAIQPVMEEAGGTFTDWQGNPTFTSGEGIGTNGKERWSPHHGTETANGTDRTQGTHLLLNNRGLIRCQPTAAVFSGPGRRRPAFLTNTVLPDFPVARQFGAAARNSRGSLVSKFFGEVLFEP